MYPATAVGMQYSAQRQRESSLQIRKKQIETLCSNFSALVEVAPDAEYEVPFLVGSDVSALLKIYLTDQFPRMPPRLLVLPSNLQHPSIDADGFIVPKAHSKLESWNMHYNLGKLIQELLTSLNDATFKGHSASSIPENNLPPKRIDESVTKAASSDGFSNRTFHDSGSDISLPSPPSHFKELDDMPEYEVIALLEDEKELKAFVANLECVQSIKTLRNDLRDGNVNLAGITSFSVTDHNVLPERNLALKQEILKLVEELEVDKAKLSEKCSNFESKQQRQRELIEKNSTSSLQHQLEKELQMQECQSENVVDEFLQGNCEVQDFIETYLERRKQYHILQSKLSFVTPQHSSRYSEPNLSETLYSF